MVLTNHYLLLRQTAESGAGMTKTLLTLLNVRYSCVFCYLDFIIRSRKEQLYLHIKIINCETMNHCTRPNVEIAYSHGLYYMIS